MRCAARPTPSASSRSSPGSDVGSRGHATATNLEIGFLSELSLSNLQVLRHDVRTDEFPERAFELIHARATRRLPERGAIRQAEQR
jgi:hypothetical protein